MAKVLFDFTRIVSIFGNYPNKDLLFIYDLSKFIEAIILYDSIILSEPPLSVYDKNQIFGKGLFDLKKKQYNLIFRTILKEYPRTIDNEISEFINKMRKDMKKFKNSRFYFSTQDIASLPDVKNKIIKSNFQFLDKQELSDENILSSMSRVRILHFVASLLQVAYDPILFRTPIACELPPVNINEVYIGPYKKFEKKVYEYLREICGEIPFVRIPLMFNIVLRECRTNEPDDLFKIALQLREDPMISKFRKVFDNYLTAQNKIDVPKMAQAGHLLNEQAKLLCNELSGFQYSTLPDYRPKFTLFFIKYFPDVKKFINNIKYYEVYPVFTNFKELVREHTYTLIPSDQKLYEVLGKNLMKG